MATRESGWSRERISDRRPLGEHAGESGASLERALLDGVTPVVLKTFTCDNDVVMRLTDDAGRAAQLFLDGAFDGLPPDLAHATLDAWEHETGWVLVLEDVGAGLIPLDRVPVPTTDLRRIVAAAAGLHEAFWGRSPSRLVPLRRRVELMMPTFIQARNETEDRLQAWILDGWSAFWELVDGDVGDAVRAIHANPSGISERLAADGTTLLHGDLWLQNVSLLDDRVAFIDWAMATSGPVAVEWAYFLGINHWQLECTHEEVLELVLQEEQGRLDPRTMDVALLWGLASYGWNKAWHVLNNEDSVANARETADLAWWVDRGRRALRIWSPT